MAIVISVCFLFVVVILAIVNDNVEKLKNKVTCLVDKHNGLVDLTDKTFEALYDELNQRIDEINGEFHNVYQVVMEWQDIDNDIIDAMELMCDTDEGVLNRVYDIEEELALINAELDDIIVDMFMDEVDEVEEKPAKKSKKK